MKARFCVKRKTLLLIAGIVWMIAGFNVARLGVLSYFNIERKWYRPFWNFFDLKAYLIMTCMMSGGIGFRAAGIFPEMFIAFFYSGLGFALALAGVIFARNYLFYNQLIEEEQD